MTGPLQALASRYDWLAAKGEVPAYGFSWEKISYALVLGPEGGVLDVAPLLDISGKKPQPRSMLVPQAIKRTSGVASNFLWDKTSYVLGVSAKQGKRLVEEHAAFVKLHVDLLAGTNDEGLQALLAFLRSWKLERFADPPFRPEMLDANFVFRFDGSFLHDRPPAQTIWRARLGSADATEAFCLVTGEKGPIARLHPSIKGVAGAQSSGASLVSFNLDAFTSYGNEQGANAPVSEAAAFGYGAVLNALLTRDSRNSIRIGDATVVFWAENDRAETLVRSFFEPPGPDDRSEAAVLRPILEQMAQGRPIREVIPEIEPDTRFFILGLAPNAARLSIRFWLETSFGELARRFQDWWRDLRIEPNPWGGRPPAIWRLLYELAAQRKAENVPAHLAGELTRAVLSGGRLPRSLLATAIMRLRADHDVNGRRAAVCKSVLTRELRFQDSLKEDRLVSLDPDNPNPGYRLGRLFAVLENVQRTALGGNVNATIRDRYYGAASATPASVFPVLIRNANHHLANLRKAAKGGLAYTFEREMGGILDGIGAAFPRNLGVEDQGRFAIGYYHERFSRGSSLPDSGEPDTIDTSEKD